MSGVAVPAMQKKDGLLETVAKGLGIASSIYGIKADMAKIDAAKAAEEKKAEQESAQARGLRTPAELAELSKTHDFSDSPMANAVKLYRKDEQGKESPLWASVRQKKEAPKEIDPIQSQRLALDREKFEWEKKQPKGGGSGVGPDGQPIPKSLNAEERKRLDSASMGLAAVKGMGTALGSGSNTFSLIGDNPYTVARTKFEEALGRMQSGGAINKDEEARFRSMAPTVMDSPEIQKQKLEELYVEMALRVKSLGQDPDEVLARRDSIQLPGFGGQKNGEAIAAPASGPKPGTVESGYRFKGGDPADKANWEKVK